MVATTDVNTAKKPRLLLIDDSKLIRKAAEKMLARDFDLVLAEDGVQGWQLIEKDSSIQVVFSDLMMPNMDGFQLLEKIRSSDQECISKLPVIVVTGADNSEAAKEKAFALGATDFITKPFNATNLKARANAHCGYQAQTKSLLDQVNVDNVTGLLNKQAFEVRLAKDLSFVARHQHPLAVLLVELDGYKNLYDQVGRKGYDSIVKQIAKTLQASVRQEDTVARAGLARFMVSLPTAKAAGAVGLAQRICNQVAAFTISFQGQPLAVSLSMGVCTIAVGKRTEASKVIANASKALEQAQLLGVSQVCAQDMDGEPLIRTLSIDQLLKELQANGKLDAATEMDSVVSTLRPIIALLNDEQKKILLS